MSELQFNYRCFAQVTLENANDNGPLSACCPDVDRSNAEGGNFRSPGLRGDTAARFANDRQGNCRNVDRGLATRSRRRRRGPDIRLGFPFRVMVTRDLILEPLGEVR
ncbi:hypothetical protein [Ruegeria lacuscaerulensis]|uniref:hypothetical protein n=1 Tax=Ruegeria lacuscaerulensis TaxID=55218 RepID=UPI00147BD1B2|nr:hypothetical protein [Ruegeria lacuscaerulensis]